MNALPHSGLVEWLQAAADDRDGHYHLTFAEHHLGNIYIRSFHGGVTGAMMELCAETETCRQLGSRVDEKTSVSVISTSIDYLRITRDSDLYARASIQRLSRRLCVVDVSCWQDDENTPVAQGIVTLKITQAD